MRRRSAALVGIVLAMTMAFNVPAHAGPVVPYQAHPHGRSYQAWLRVVGRWFLGDESNPLVAGLVDGDCGRVIDGVFIMTAPIDIGVKFDCLVPTGVPILLSHAAINTVEGIDGDTDAELHAAAKAGFVSTSNSLTIDGGPIRLRSIDAGVFDVIAKPGSLYDSVGLGTGAIRTGLIGNLVFMHPLPPGDHVIETEVTFIGSGGAYSASYHVRVSQRG